MLSEWFVLLAISIFLIAYIRVNVIYSHYKFVLGEHAFHLKKGLFFTRENTIPYQQISNVHIARPYHYRIFGIAQLDIVTAGDKSIDRMSNKTKEYLIPIIDVSIARELSKMLMEFASKTRKGDSYREVDETDDESEDEEDIINETNKIEVLL